MRASLSASVATKKSMSPVARGLRYRLQAYPPIIMNRRPFEIISAINSLKSGGSMVVRPHQLHEGCKTFVDGQVVVVKKCRIFGFWQAVELAKQFFHGAGRKEGVSSE